MKIAVFGGAFNPVHKGHSEIAAKCAEYLSCDKLIIMPSGISPHKSSDALADNKHRINMCRLAFSDIKNCEVSELEVERNGKSYTVDTLEKLHVMYPSAKLYLICGSDMFLTLHTWKNPERLFSLCTVCAFLRENQNMDEMKDYAEIIKSRGADTVLCDYVIPPFSSTAIREQIKNGIFDSNALDDKVCKYIRKNKLYQR